MRASLRALEHGEQGVPSMVMADGAAAAWPVHRTCLAQAARPVPRVSVVVPAYGVSAFLGAALASLQAQSLEDWEALVVDDGDRDAVAAAFAPFAGDPRMRLIQTGNGGVAAARNRGLAEARADAIAFLDGDDLYEADYLERMLRALDEHPEAGFVACDALLFGKGPRSNTLFSETYPIEGPVTLERVLSRRVNIFTATLVRRRALEDVGGYEPDLRRAEDLDLWIRLLARGWGAVTLAAPLARYRRRPGSLSGDLRPLLQDCRRVYERAADMLDGRPEARTAEAIAEGYGRKLAWADGEALILSGRVSAGLALLADAAGRSPRWRWALAAMRLSPALARPLLWARALLPQPWHR